MSISNECVLKTRLMLNKHVTIRAVKVNKKYVSEIVVYVKRYSSEISSIKNRYYSIPIKPFYALCCHNNNDNSIQFCHT